MQFVEVAGLEFPRSGSAVGSSVLASGAAAGLAHDEAIRITNKAMDLGIT